MQRVWHQPWKYPEPVMKGKYQWEADCPCLYGTVLRIDGRFRMWYVGTRNSSKPRICYAESTNGIDWDRPELGICEYRGSKKNNIFIQPKREDGFLDDCSMIYEPDTEWPFKLLYWDWTDGDSRSWGIYQANSKDGIRFETPTMILPAWDDRFIAVTQKVDGKYRIYGRGTFLSGMDASGRWTDGKPFLTEYSLPPFPLKRPVVYTESEDLVTWTDGKQLIKPDLDDQPQMQIYDISPFRYEGAWLGTMLRMHTTPDVLDPELIWSHDGTSWQRTLRREPFIPRGPQGSFDSVWLNLATNPPIYHYNQLWFYYSGRAGGHGGQFPEEYGAIGLAVMRVDGFCSIQAREGAGGLLTKPMTWVDGDLLINADPRREITGHHTNDTTDGGRIRVEVRGEQNHPIEGFRFEDSSQIVRNTRNFEEDSNWTVPERDQIGVQPITWNGRSARELAGKRIRLFFEIQDAHLYSFRASTGKDGVASGRASDEAVFGVTPG